jgi:hypothetical protein
MATIRCFREPLRRHVLDDPEVAFVNLAKAARPGVRLCFVCWQEMFANDANNANLLSGCHMDP